MTPMLKRILFVLLGLLVLGALGFGVIRLFSRRAPEAPQGTPSPGASEEPLFGEGGGENTEAPLFAASPGTSTEGGERTTGTVTLGGPQAGTGTGGLSAELDPATWSGRDDSDGDGLPNDLERIYHTDETNPDTDGDGFKDGEEVQNGYNPVRPGGVRLDTDEDGLLEHDEFKWKTNPFNPDTDGDGFKDGEEVQNGFDPTQPGDGRGSDALPARRAQAAEQTIERFRPDPNSGNYTEGLAGVLLGSRPASEAGGVQITPEKIEQVLSGAKLNTTIPEVSVSEIRTEATNTPNDIQKYLSAIDAARPTDLGRGGALTAALTEAFQGNSAALAQVRGRIEQYERALLGIPAPASAVRHHVLQIALIRFATQRLATIEREAVRDPVRAYLAAREIQEGLPPHIKELQDLRKNLDALARGTGGTP